jgi:hypothetical protein
MKSYEVPVGAQGVDTSADVTAAQARALYASGIDFLWCYTGLPANVGKNNVTPEKLQGYADGRLLVAPVQFFRSSGWSKETGLADGSRAMSDANAAGFLPDVHRACDLEGGGMTPADVEAYTEAWHQGPMVTYIGPGTPRCAAANDLLWHSGAIVPWTADECAIQQSQSQVNVTRGGTVVDIDVVTKPGVRMQGADDWTPRSTAVPTAYSGPSLPNLTDLCLGRAGDTPGVKAWRAITFFVGASLHTHPELLTALAAIDDPENPAKWAALKTNCATTMRWILALIGCPSRFVTQHDTIGTSLTWDIQAAQELGALLPATPANVALLDVGWGLHYGTPGSNNDHMEWCGPGTGFVRDHAGGGREDNAITLDHSDVRWSVGRPLLHVIDINKMNIPCVWSPDWQAFGDALKLVR